MTERSRTRSRSRWPMVAMVAPLTAATFAGTITWAKANPPAAVQKITTTSGHGSGEASGSGTSQESFVEADNGAGAAALEGAGAQSAAGTEACLTSKELKNLQATVRKLRAQINAINGTGAGGTASGGTAAGGTAASGTKAPAGNGGAGSGTSSQAPRTTPAPRAPQAPRTTQAPKPRTPAPAPQAQTGASA
jgi:hypothetical protein